MTRLFERAVSAILAVAALGVAGASVHREFAPRTAPREERASQYVTEWRSMLPSAHVVGSMRAPVTMIEFVDFQCPFCRTYNKTVKSVRTKYGDLVAIAYVHLPLTMHQHARAAAVAAECAGKAGRFTDVVDVLYEQQDSLGKKPWTWFAAKAGVADTARFSACLSDSTAVPIVAAGEKLAAASGIRATPTLILNGWRYGTIPSDTELVRAVGDLLLEKRPYKNFPQAAVPSKRRPED